MTSTLNPNLRSFWETQITPDGDAVRFRTLYGGRMSSKCLGKDTPVLMYDGTISPVQDIRTGDLVMGPDSLPRIVLDTTYGVDELFKVNQTYADDYVVNSDHILSLMKTDANRYPEIGSVLNINVKSFAKQSAKFRTIFKGYKVGQDYEEKNLPVDPYFLGLWLGDGDSARLSITTSDSEIVDFIQEFAKANNLEVKNDAKYRYRLIDKSKKASLWKEFGKLGVTLYHPDRRSYSFAKKIPQQYISSSRVQRLRLLAGLIDSDGHVDSRGNYIISSSYIELASGIKRLADSLGFRTAMHRNKTTHRDSYSIRVSGYGVSFIPVLLPRKKVKEKHQNNKNPTCSVSIESIGHGEYFGFSVDRDHLFCLGDGTVTHNSHDAAGMAIARANFRPERFLCLRMYQNRISDSVYTLLKDKIEYFGLQDNFKVYADAIEHKTNGSLFRFYGMARNVDEIKSFEGATIAWVEEAHSLTSEMYEVIRPTIMRNDGAEFWITFNPKLSNDFVYKRFVTNPPRGAISKLVNYPDNPFLSKTALEDIEASKEEDYEAYQHIYLGVPNDNDDSVVIKRGWIQSAIDAHKKIEPSTGIWNGQKVVGYDVADDGNDKNASTVANGSIIEAVEEWKGGEDQLRESAARVKQTAEASKANLIGYDSIGVGAGTGSHLNAMQWPRHFKFNAGSKVVHPKKDYAKTKIKNEEFFANLKAQAWWILADRFRNTHLAVTKPEQYQFPADEMISISSEIDSKILDRLIDELSQPKRDYDNQGKVKVESKKDLAKRGVASPNLADSVIIATSRGLLSRASMFDAV